MLVPGALSLKMKCEMFQYFRASDPSLAACTLVAGTSRRDKATPKPCTNSSPPASIRPYKCSRLPSSQRCWRCRFQRTRSPLQRFKPYRQHQRARRRNGLPMPTSSSAGAQDAPKSPIVWSSSVSHSPDLIQTRNATGSRWCSAPETGMKVHPLDCRQQTSLRTAMDRSS